MPDWLVLVHQLPATPSNLRVRVWRRMQQIGAIALKQAVWVLPNLATTREDFEWLRAEIEGFGGQATVLTAQTLEGGAHESLVDEFRKHREDAYRALLKDVARVDAQIRRRRPSAPRFDRRVTQSFRDRLAAIDRIDYFGSAGRDAVLTLIQQVERPGKGAAKETPDKMGAESGPDGESGRLWVTRPRPGVDRMASAWLIRRFIDSSARFGFVPDRASAPHGSVPFDMFGVELTHRGDRCTFEVLCEAHRLQEPAIAEIATIVHDLDLKDGRFGAEAAPTVGSLIDGLQLAQPDDHTLLEEGMRLFEALYLSLARSERLTAPRRPKKRVGASAGPTQRRRGTRR